MDADQASSLISDAYDGVEVNTNFVLVEKVSLSKWSNIPATKYRLCKIVKSSDGPNDGGKTYPVGHMIIVPEDKYILLRCNGTRCCLVQKEDIIISAKTLE